MAFDRANDDLDCSPVCSHIFIDILHCMHTASSNWVLPKQVKLAVHRWTWLFKGEVDILPQLVHSLQCYAAQQLSREVQSTSKFQLCHEQATTYNVGTEGQWCVRRS